MSYKIASLSKSLVMACIGIFALGALAAEVNITEKKASAKAVHNGKIMTIERIQDQEHMLSGAYTKTSRKCPPFCIQPMSVAPGVTTVGELELLDFIEKKVNNGTGVLVDARTASWHAKGTIPGSINIPFTTFDEEESDLVKSVALAKLGVRKNLSPSFLGSAWVKMKRLTGINEYANTKWDFSNAKEVLLWCNGMWCGQSPRAIKGLLKLGYPPDKIFYYRGGMQSWLMLGLTVVSPTGE